MSDSQTDPTTLYECLKWLMHNEGRIDFRREVAGSFFTDEHHGVVIDAMYITASGDPQKVASHPIWLSQELAVAPEAVFTAIMCRAVASMQRLIKQRACA